MVERDRRLVPSRRAMMRSNASNVSSRATFPWAEHQAPADKQVGLGERHPLDGEPPSGAGQVA